MSINYVDPSTGNLTPIAGTPAKVINSISNPNLLDNAWFTVNQRGLSSYSGAAQYTIDRWKIVNNKGELTVNSNGSITVAANDGDTWLQHRIEPSVLKSLVGKTITLSIDAVKTGGYVNLYSGYYDSTNTWQRISEDKGINTTRSIVSRTCVVPTLVDNNPKFAEYGIYIARGQSVTIYSTKLELGLASTLANDVAPNYQQELAKCQRYFVRLKPTTDEYASFSGLGFVFSATETRASIDLPVPMRATPTISKSGAIGFIGITSAGITILNSADIQSVTLYDDVSHWHFMIGLKHATGVEPTIGTLGYIRAMNDASAYIDFSADL